MVIFTVSTYYIMGHVRPLTSWYLDAFIKENALEILFSSQITGRCDKGLGMVSTSTGYVRDGWRAMCSICIEEKRVCRRSHEVRCSRGMRSGPNH